MQKSIVVTATGDALISRRLPEYQHAAFQGMLDLIRSTDAAFTNMEIVLSDYTGHPVMESGGVNISTDPRVAEDLKNLGFNLMAFANNHTLNYGEHGCLRTLDVLRDLDIVCAGAGHHLFEARMPRYLETLHGRVGLVACASTFGTGQQASPQREDVAGRPGLNPQRFDRLFVVDQEHYDAVQRIAERTGANKWHDWLINMGFRQPPKREGELILGDRSFIIGDQFEIRTEPHAGDLEGNMKAIADAADLSDLVIASMHCHEPKNEVWEPADFIPTVARAFIDAGADMFVGHGPHMLRGLEIYKGKPIFYSVGNFIFQHEYVQRVPADDYVSLGADPAGSARDVFLTLNDQHRRSFITNDLYWETVLPICTFEDRQITSITLHPLTLGPGQPWPNRGTPELAQPDHAQRILEWMAELSKPYGTTITIHDGIGTVEVA